MVNDYLAEQASEIYEETIDPNRIRALLGTLSNGKAVGLRGISNEMLKYNSSTALPSVIASTFEIMINYKVTPEIFNLSVIKPLIKDHNKPSDDMNKIRPVAISDAISNLYERVLLGKLKEKHIDSDKQFGFKSNSSCNHAVFILKVAASIAKSRGQRLYACALDVSKAFDKVCRNKLWLLLIEKASQTVSS